MTELAANLRNREIRRAVLVSTSLLAVLVAGGIVFGVVEQLRDVADRTT